MPSRYPFFVSDSELASLQNPVSGYFFDNTPTNLSLVDLAVICITKATFENIQSIAHLVVLPRYSQAYPTCALMMLTNAFWFCQ